MIEFHHSVVSGYSINADVAQLVEQLICNQQVAGSSPIVGSIAPNRKSVAITLATSVVYSYLLSKRMGA